MCVRPVCLRMCVCVGVQMRHTHTDRQPGRQTDRQAGVDGDSDSDGAALKI